VFRWWISPWRVSPIRRSTRDRSIQLWDAHLKNGGKAEQCGWLQDRWGLYWQIVPRGFSEMMQSSNREGAKRAATAMLKMVKLDMAALQCAFDGS